MCERVGAQMQTAPTSVFRVSYVGGRSRDRYRGQGTNDGHQFICALCVRTYRLKVSGGSSASASLAVREAACGNAWLRSPDRDTPLKI